MVISRTAPRRRDGREAPGARVTAHDTACGVGPLAPPTSGTDWRAGLWGLQLTAVGFRQKNVPAPFDFRGRKARGSILRRRNEFGSGAAELRWILPGKRRFPHKSTTDLHEAAQVLVRVLASALALEKMKIGESARQTGGLLV